MTTPFDAGLQPERTLLSWRRTCLSLALGSVVVVRFTAEEFGAVGVLLGVIGVLLASAAYVAAAVRYRRTHSALTRSSSLASDGLPLAFVAVTLVLLGIACGLYVVSHAAAGFDAAGLAAGGPVTGGVAAAGGSVPGGSVAGGFGAGG